MLSRLVPGLGHRDEEVRFWRRHWLRNSTASPPHTRDPVSRCTLRFKWIQVKVQGAAEAWRPRWKLERNAGKEMEADADEGRKSLASDYCETGGTN